MRFCILNAGGKFPCGKTPEYNGVNNPDACTGKHRDYRFGDHGHIDDNTVTLPNTQLPEPPCTSCHEIPQLPIRVTFYGFCNRAVIDQGNVVF